jgi:hypothetical protein
MTFYIQFVEIDSKPMVLKKQAYSSENIEYLCQDDDMKFPLLSQVDPYYPLDFYPGNMNDLIEELQQVKLTVENLNEISHIDEIISMCRECKLHQNTAIIFNPFSPIPMVVR